MGPYNVVNVSLLFTAWRSTLRRLYGNELLRRLSLYFDVLFHLTWPWMKKVQYLRNHKALFGFVKVYINLISTYLSEIHYPYYNFLSKSLVFDLTSNILNYLVEIVTLDKSRFSKIDKKQPTLWWYTFYELKLICSLVC